MAKRGEVQNFQLRITGPATSWTNGRRENWKTSYVSCDTAVGRAQDASRSREVRGPASHVIVVDKRDEAVQFEWHGPQTPEGVANGGQSVERCPAWS
jgi:hypothetical protein